MDQYEKPWTHAWVPKTPRSIRHTCARYARGALHACIACTLCVHCHIGSYSRIQPPHQWRAAYPSNGWFRAHPPIQAQGAQPSSARHEPDLRPEPATAMIAVGPHTALHGVHSHGPKYASHDPRPEVPSWLAQRLGCAWAERLFKRACARLGGLSTHAEES